jgi:hypothetical protein
MVNSTGAVKTYSYMPFLIFLILILLLLGSTDY